MGASSVTGTGQGSSTPNRGPQNGRSQYVPLVTSHIVTCGAITLSGGAGTYVFPSPLADAPAKFVVMLCPVNSAVNANETVLVSKAGSTTFTGFTVAGTGSQVVQFLVATVAVA